jgi:hypothetical protein
MRPLLFRADAGILDRTHLHFFYKDSALKLARSVGLEIENGLISGLQGRKLPGSID